MSTTSATVCVRCLQPIADRSTYIPGAPGPMHPHCWEVSQRPSARDLEAALREAKRRIECFRDGVFSDRGANNAIAAIEVALCAASVGASGEIECLGCPEIGPGCLCPRAIASRRPAPSEAPSVERAQPINRPHEEEARALVKYTIAEYVTPSSDDCEEAWARIMRALATARAEGIAAEREKWDHLVNDHRWLCDQVALVERTSRRSKP